MRRRVALIAGSGALVPAVAAAVRNSGDDLQVVSVVSRDDLDADALRLNPLRVAELIAAITQYRATHIAMAGGIHLSDDDRREIAVALSGDRNAVVGDMALGHMASRLSALTGAALIDLDTLVPSLMAPEGWIAGPEPSDGQRATAVYAFKRARAAGELDLCQALVVSGRRLVAIEDIGGTDLLLDRVASFRSRGLVQHGMVLAKTSKPGQPAYFDLPAIGPVTIEKAAQAGVSAIVVEAHRTLLLERSEIESLAAQLGVAVFGLATDV